MHTVESDVSQATALLAVRPRMDAVVPRTKILFVAHGHREIAVVQLGSVVDRKNTVVMAVNLARVDGELSIMEPLSVQAAM